MLVLIASALTKTLTSYLFGSYLKSHYGSIEIDGAPRWYGSEYNDEICVSTFKRGDLESIELAKDDSKIKLEKKLKGIVGVVITKRFKNVTPENREFLSKVRNDETVSTFINSHTNYKNIKYDEDKKMSFVRNCVLKEDFIEYEKNSIKKFVKELSYHKANRAFDELDGKPTSKEGGHAGDAFDELDEIN